jgi:hypothetical protein
MSINIGKGGSGKMNSTKGGSGKLIEKKYIDLLPAKSNLTFLFDPIFYKKEIQNERYKILVSGCSLSYVNGIYSQTVNPKLYNNRPYFIKDDDTDMAIYDDGAGSWVIRDSNQRDYTDIFIKINNCNTSDCRPDEVNWNSPNGGDALGNETPPTITRYLNLTDGRADLDPAYLEELRNYQINGIIPTFPNLNVKQHIPGAPFNSRKAEFANNTYRYIKYNNNDDVEHLKIHGKIIYDNLTDAAAGERGKNLKDLINPLLKLRKNDSGSAIFVGNQDYTLNMFIKLQRPVSHTSPTNYLVREKRGIFLTSCAVGGDEGVHRALIIGYRSPYYNIDGDTTYKLKFEPFSFVFSFGLAWTSQFGYGNFTLMTDYKYNFNEMYMLSISRQSNEFKIYINGEQQTTALLSFNPCVIPSATNCRSRQQHFTRMQIAPLAPGFVMKNGSIYNLTNTSWTSASVGGGNHEYLCFGKSRRSNMKNLPARHDIQHHRRKRYLNNLDIGVINSYNIALSQIQISEIYNNFRYKYL